MTRQDDHLADNTLSRRKFMQRSSAALATAAIVTGAKPIFAHVQSSDELRIGPEEYRGIASR